MSLILIVLSTWIHPLLTHEFHISKCQIEYRSELETVQVMLHIYIDDFELALQQQGAENLFLCTDKEASDADTFIFNYLKQQFRIHIDGKEATFSYVGKEPSEDLMAVWCYLEIEQTPSFKEVTVHNQILLELFDDQKNVTSIIGPDRKKAYYLFQQNQSKETFTF